LGSGDIAALVKTAPHAVEGNRRKRITDHERTKRRAMKGKSGLLQQTVGTDAFRIGGRLPWEDEFMTILNN
jgi:hypothetical protein